MCQQVVNEDDKINQRPIVPELDAKLNGKVIANDEPLSAVHSPDTKENAAKPGIPEFISDEPISAYTYVDYSQPHWKRRKLLTEAHPHLKSLNGVDNMSGLYTIALNIGLLSMAYLLKDSSFWVMFPFAYVFGAVMNHALWVLIHDFGHDMGYETTWLNNVFLCIANLPQVAPASVTFAYYHRLHHTHLNETYADPDVPSPWEHEMFGNSALGKIGYLAFFPILQSIRTLRFTEFNNDKWVIVNWVTTMAVNLSVLYFFGFRAFLFLFISSYFALSLHPVGARWIAEHYAVKPKQETYSYYGPINNVAFNIGYHNEHHDLPRVPWSKLPQIRQMAPEYYEPLYKHDSYLQVLWTFFFNPNFTLQTRVVRESTKHK